MPIAYCLLPVPCCLKKEVVEYSDVGFPPAYGTPTEWFESQVQDSILRALIGENIHDAIVEYTTNDDGFVDEVRFFSFPNNSTGKTIKRELETIIRNMPQWDPAKTETRYHLFVITGCRIPTEPFSPNGL